MFPRMWLSVSHFRRLNLMLAGMALTTRILELRGFRQHGKTSVFEHSLNVANTSVKLARLLRWRVDENAMLRGALLHDYFLYDWHDKLRRPELPGLHGFVHPAIALANARRDCALGSTEADIIEHHMFPLTLAPPKTKEGFLVSLADKICSLKETLARRHAAERKTLG